MLPSGALFFSFVLVFVVFCETQAIKFGQIPLIHDDFKIFSPNENLVKQLPEVWDCVNCNDTNHGLIHHMKYITIEINFLRSKTNSPAIYEMSGGARLNISEVASLESIVNNVTISKEDRIIERIIEPLVVDGAASSNLGSQESSRTTETVSSTSQLSNITETQSQQNKPPVASRNFDRPPIRGGEAMMHARQHHKPTVASTISPAQRKQNGNGMPAAKRPKPEKYSSSTLWTANNVVCVLLGVFISLAIYNVWSSLNEHDHEEQAAESTPGSQSRFVYDRVRMAEVEQEILACLRAGCYAEAAALVKQVLPAVAEAKGERHPDVGAMMHYLAKAYLGQGCFAEAYDTLQEVLQICEPFGQNIDFAYALEDYGVVLEALLSRRELGQAAVHLSNGRTVGAPDVVSVFKTAFRIYCEEVFVRAFAAANRDVAEGSHGGSSAAAATAAAEERDAQLCYRELAVQAADFDEYAFSKIKTPIRAQLTRKHGESDADKENRHGDSSRPVSLATATTAESPSMPVEMKADSPDSLLRKSLEELEMLLTSNDDGDHASSCQPPAGGTLPTLPQKYNLYGVQVTECPVDKDVGRILSRIASVLHDFEQWEEAREYWRTAQGIFTDLGQGFEQELIGVTAAFEECEAHVQKAKCSEFEDSPQLVAKQIENEIKS